MVESTILAELLGQDYEKKLSQYNEVQLAPYGNKTITLPSQEGRIIGGADFHGRKDVWMCFLDYFLNKSLFTGKNAFAVSVGDLIDGIEGYQDDSKEILISAIELNRIIPNRIKFLKGNHEDAYAGGLKVIKGEANQTEKFLKVLTEEEIEFIKSMPDILILENGIICGHNPPKYFKSKEDFEDEELNRYKGNSSAYKKTPHGSTMWGDADKERTINRYDAKDVKKCLKSLGGKVFIAGHTGISEIEAIRENGTISRYTGINGVRDLSDMGLVLIATGETKGAEDIFVASTNLEEKIKLYIIDLKSKTNRPYETIEIEIAKPATSIEEKNRILTKWEKLEMIIKSENLRIDDAFVKKLEKLSDEDFDRKVDEYYKKGFFTEKKPY